MKLIRPKAQLLYVPKRQFILTHIERAARTCYQSFEKNTAEKEELAERLLSSCLKQGHHSVFEHVSVTVRIICDRGVSHELVRHRIAAYSQESTRYCAYDGSIVFILPPWIKDISPGVYADENEGYLESKNWQWAIAMKNAEAAYQSLRREGWSPQRARAVLPNSLKTEIIMSANLREWRHIFTLRCSTKAHPQMREIMLPLLADFHQRVMPLYYQDLFEQYLPEGGGDLIV